MGDFICSNAGDFNGDGIGDFMVSDSAYNYGDGAVYVLFGTAVANANNVTDEITLSDIASGDNTRGFAVLGVTGSKLGASVSCAGERLVLF